MKNTQIFVLILALVASCNKSNSDPESGSGFPVTADAETEQMQADTAPKITTSEEFDAALKQLASTVSPAQFFEPSDESTSSSNERGMGSNNGRTIKSFMLCAEEKTVANEVSFAEEKFLKVKYAIDLASCKADPEQKHSGTLSVSVDSQIKKACYENAPRENGWKVIQATDVPTCYIDQTSLRTHKIVTTVRQDGQIDGSTRTLSILNEAKNGQDRCANKRTSSEKKIGQCTYRHIYATTEASKSETTKTAFYGELKIIEALQCKTNLFSCTKGKAEIRINNWKASLDFATQRSRNGYADFTNGENGDKFTVSFYGKYASRSGVYTSEVNVDHQEGSRMLFEGVKNFRVTF